MRNLIIGTAGHIDHGKTELIKALTGVDTDRLKDEKERGISIDLGFARFPLKGEDLLIGVVDVPGHEAFIRNMLAGVTGIDLVLFVIAADEGVMPQTTEHLDILRFLDVKQGILVITKADLVEDDWLELIVEDARELMRGTFMERAQVVITSTRTGRGLEELKDTLLAVARQTDTKPTDDLFRLPIDRVFTIKGRGTVVTGTVWSGSVGVDQVVTIHPSGRTARVKSIQVHSEEQANASAGTRVALALSGISREEIERGSTALQMEGWGTSMMFEGYIHYLPHGTKPLKNRTRVRFHLATQEVMGRVVLLEGSELSEGDRAFVQVRLEGPVVTRRGDHFVMRSYSPLTTIGGGIVLVPYAKKRTKVGSEQRQHLECLRDGSEHEIVEAIIKDQGLGGYPAKRLPVDVGSRPKVVDEILEELQQRGDIIDLKGELYHSSVFEELSARVLEELEFYHNENPLQQGVRRDELRHRIRGVFSITLLEGVLSRLMEQGKIELAGGEVKLVSHEIVFSGGTDTLADEILFVLSGEPLSPPDLGKLSAQLDSGKGKILELLSALQKKGEVVKIDENIWMVSAGVKIAHEKVEEFLREREKATASELRELLNVSRKYAIPILEYLDRIGVTYRKGDYRYLKG